ncbi:Pls/PosA family non-ribosomal peptide synthetase [Pseudonocardia xinjiangensis]|uniref:Peptide synthetase n=1 Tax=Pseudonocardia xinjiangensis TaxID=75289 RepID=A0ABX1R8Z0_9PSEU|nr:Pls/PosA family non-ribosomal peptide synthetase [Pseudonocardia xinjiangensis]NMH76843.1 peptide synthetase [Pseudonocardia xinjiangensis]
MFRASPHLRQGAQVVAKSVDVLAVDPAQSTTLQPVSAGPSAGTDERLAAALAEVVGVQHVSVDSHFFDDLGADSMVMARFCARVRKRPDLPAVSMKDIYRYQTISRLAAALSHEVAAPVEAPEPAPADVVKPARGWEYVLCGALQLLIFLTYTYLAAEVMERGYEWISVAPGILEIYLRSVVFGAAAVLALCIVPIIAKWLIIGRWKPRQIRVWSLGYVRFWVVKVLVRSNPLLLMIGMRSRTSASSPLYALYLRALGAKIGRGVTIYSRNVPLCTDLLTIGDGSVIRKDAFINGYRANNGVIQTGPVTLGKEVFVGEMSVVDINTSMGDRAQLGHTSSLHSGQVIPDREIWSGSPAQRSQGSYRMAGPVRVTATRRTVYGILQLLNGLFVFMPLLISGLIILLAEVPQLNALLDPGPMVFTSWEFYLHALIISMVLFFGGTLVGLLVVMTVPRVFNLAIKPDRDYRLYGIRYAAQRMVARLTNPKFFTFMLGDSSYIVNYLHWLGYKFPDVVQTGSNFGMDLKHENPYHSTIGSGTMVADGLSIVNADFSSTSFRVSPTAIGARNFLGNFIVYPAQGRTGDNCLLATKVMVPFGGVARNDVGLLGSPHFEIPRTVQRDTRFDHMKTAEELPRRLAAKNRYNIATMGVVLLVRSINVFVVTLFALGAADLYPLLGAVSIAIGGVLALLFSLFYTVLMERLVAGFKDLRPKVCSIYDPYFWWHERYWKLSAQPKILDGTPFKGLAWRLLGVRIGKRVFDDGCGIVEKTLVTIGDDCTLNAGSKIQCHSQEDGAFKSDHIVIGSGCTLGVSSMVHYGVTMGNGSALAADAFLMKGEEMPKNARWGGNPAREMREDHGRMALAVIPPQLVARHAQSH